MKSIKHFLILSLLPSLLFFISCGKDDNEAEPAEYVTMMMDNALIDMNSLGGSARADKTQINIGIGFLNTLSVNISLGNGYRLEIYIPGYDGPSTYLTATELNYTPIGGQSNRFTLTREDDQETWESGQSIIDIPNVTPGEFIVHKEENGYIKGVFFFDAYDGSEVSKKVVTDGKFKIELDKNEF